MFSVLWATQDSQLYYYRAKTTIYNKINTCICVIIKLYLQNWYQDDAHWSLLTLDRRDWEISLLEKHNSGIAVQYKFKFINQLNQSCDFFLQQYSYMLVEKKRRQMEGVMHNWWFIRSINQKEAKIMR